MKQYSHYSFDLWLTLIKSNPAYKYKRAEYFHSRFNPKKLSIENIMKAFSMVDELCNYSAESTGLAIKSEEMYAMALRLIGYEENLSVGDLYSIYNAVEQIFFEYPPEPYDSNTIPTLKKLVSDGASLSILSNTGYAAGYTMSTLIDRIGLLDFVPFKFKVFSDQLGFAKPNSLAYYKIRQQVEPGVWAKNILHVGDNPIADKGNIDYNIDSFIINSNDKTIKDLLW